MYSYFFSFRLLLWEEVKPNMLEKIEDVEQPLEHILEEVKLRYLIRYLVIVDLLIKSFYGYYFVHTYMI